MTESDTPRFIRLVREMRRLQREYHLNGTRSLYEECRNAEMVVDRWLKEYSPDAGPKQAGLFQ